MFKDAIRAAVAYKDDSTDFMDEIMRELEVREIKFDKNLMLHSCTVISLKLHV